MGAIPAGDKAVVLPDKGAGIVVGSRLAEIVDAELTGGLVVRAVEIVVGEVCAGLLLIAEGEGSCDCNDDGHGGEDKFESFHAKKSTGIHRSGATVKKEPRVGVGYRPLERRMVISFLSWSS
jgi:hypothetical protein